MLWTFITPFKSKIYYLKQNLINLSCDIVAHNVEKSKHDTGLALPQLLWLFIEFISAWLFEIFSKDFATESEESALFIIRFNLLID